MYQQAMNSILGPQQTTREKDREAKNLSGQKALEQVAKTNITSNKLVSTTTTITSSSWPRPTIQHNSFQGAVVATSLPLHWLWFEAKEPVRPNGKNNRAGGTL